LIAVGHAAGSFALYKLDHCSSPSSSSSNRTSSSSSSSNAFQQSNPAILEYSLTCLVGRKDCAEDISDVKFSPNSKMLAVGSHDNFIDMYVDIYIHNAFVSQIKDI
jgi:WD40 repeat protein